jgi:tetratricopeptide (TPR) repeat protein
MGRHPQEAAVPHRRRRAALNVHAHAVCADRPLDALSFAETAIGLSEMLPDDTYPFQAVYDLRGTAWKERANALIRLGRLDDALESLTRAERAYRHLSAAGFGLSSVALVRAAALYQQQRLDEAAASAELAERGFAHVGQEGARMKAVQLLGEIRYENLQLDAAADVFERLIEYGKEVNDRSWIARGAYMLASCEMDRGRTAEASVLFTQALKIFRETGPATDLLSTEWGLARVVLHGGRYEDAVRRLDDVMLKFHELGMTTDAALVALDMADALLALGQTRRLNEVTTRAFRKCREAGMFRGAMTALGYLKEAAGSGRIDTALIGAVRAYIRRVDREPELIFVPPPPF